MKSARYLILVLITQVAAPVVLGEQTASPQDVGIDEKLGERVPLDLPFLDEEGQPVTLRKFVDKPTVLTLNYFRCAGLCTPLLNGVVDALNEIKLEPGKDFRVVTVSFDERDTSDIARRKRENLFKQLKRPFTPAAWHLLTGKDPSIQALVRAVGFEFKKSGSEFVHAGVIVILSGEGMVTRYMYGVHFPAADLELALREAARGEARPTIVKALQFCYTYDPASREQVFRLTRAIGAVTVVLLMIFAGLLSLRRDGREKGTP